MTPAIRGAELRRSFRQQLVDTFFGYDFFISYAHADGKAYAEGLARGLKKYGFDCFLDTKDYAKGDDWKLVGAWALKRTSRLVLVGTTAALESKPVQRELEIFTGAGKRVIPIEFEGSLSATKNPENPVLRLIGESVLRLAEQSLRLTGGPSEAVIKDLVATFETTRQSQKRQRWLQGFMIVLLLLLALAVCQGLRAETKRKEANRRLAENLYDRGLLELEEHDNRWPALLLACDAVATAPSDDPRQAVYKTRAFYLAMDGPAWVGQIGKPVDWGQFDSQFERLVTFSVPPLLNVWAIPSMSPLRTLNTAPTPLPVTSISPYIVGMSASTTDVQVHEAVDLGNTYGFGYDHQQSWDLVKGTMTSVARVVPSNGGYRMRIPPSLACRNRVSVEEIELMRKAGNGSKEIFDALAAQAPKGAQRVFSRAASTSPIRPRAKGTSVCSSHQ